MPTTPFPVMHQTDEAGAPLTDWGHVLEALNKVGWGGGGMAAGREGGGGRPLCDGGGGERERDHRCVTGRINIGGTGRPFSSGDGGSSVNLFFQPGPVHEGLILN